MCLVTLFFCVLKTNRRTRRMRAPSVVKPERFSADGAYQAKSALCPVGGKTKWLRKPKVFPFPERCENRVLLPESFACTPLYRLAPSVEINC